MIVLIPASQFRVAFDVGSGRPYSRFEALLLRAVADGAESIEDLRNTFRVHPRLVVDALVSLTREGWVAVGSGGGHNFMLTGGGRAALKTGKAPESRLIGSRSTMVVMERISGALARNDEVRFIPDKEARQMRDEALRLRPEVTANALLEGQVEPLLYHPQGEWISSIGPIDMVTKGSWVPVTVDFEENRVFGLPDSWAKLTLLLLDEARAARDKFEADVLLKSWERAPAAQRARRATLEDEEDAAPPTREHRLAIKDEDLVLGGPANDAFLRRAVSKAKQSLLVVSALANAPRLEQLRSDLSQALSRGVLLDILWGNGGTDEDQSAVLDFLKKLAYESRQRNDPGELRFNASPCRLWANILVSDDAFGSIGGYRWLSDDANGPAAAVSTVIPAGSLLVQLMRLVAGYWGTTPGAQLSSSPDRWRVISSRLDEHLSAEVAPPVTVEPSSAYLVTDRGHEIEWMDAIGNAKRRVLVAFSTPRLAADVLRRVRAVDGSPRATRVTAFVGSTTVDGDDCGLSDMGVDVVALSELRPAIVIADDWCCISDIQDAAHAASGRDERHELGIAIRGAAIADALTEWITSRQRGV